MNLPTNAFKASIAAGKPQIGLWISLCNNFAADVVASAGYDWVLLDMEHSPNEVGIALGQMQAFASGDTAQMVRPMWNDPVVVKRLLDCGASNLLFPMVQSAKEAEAAVRATRYPPHGIRGVSGAQRGNKFGRVSDYFDRVNDETCVIVQVETRAALADVEAIASVDGVDGVFFGPADIGADIGQLGKPMAPEVWDLIMPAAEKVRAVGKPVGTLVMDATKSAELVNDGFMFVACGSDIGLLARGADQLLANVRKAIS